MCKLDLKDAYLSIPITQSHRKYLKFAWQGTVYQYNVLPFGLATALRAFTKLMKPVLAHLRSKGVRLITYLDNLLIIGKDKREAKEACQNAKSLMESLGFVTNLEKSQAIATQKMEFLGFIIDSVANDIQTSQGESEGDKAEVQMCSSRANVNNTRAGPPHRDPGSNKIGSDTSAIALPQS